MRLEELPARWLAKIEVWGGWSGWLCWCWTGGGSGNGYGKTSVKGRDCMAHRAVYEYAVGPIPPGKVLDHRCRNRRCVRPSHMRVATHKENTHSGLAVLFKPRPGPQSERAV